MIQHPVNGLVMNNTFSKCSYLEIFNELHLTHIGCFTDFNWFYFLCVTLVKYLSKQLRLPHSCITLDTHPISNSSCLRINNVKNPKPIFVFWLAPRSAFDHVSNTTVILFLAYAWWSRYYMPYSLLFIKKDTSWVLLVFPFKGLFWL